MGFKDYLPFATAFFGALAGGCFAFLFGWLKEKRDEAKRQHTALLAAQFALFSQWHAIESIRRFLEPQRNHPNRATRLGTYFHSDVQLVSFDQLTFIINTKEANLLQEIHLAQMSYTQVVTAINTYNAAKREFELKHPPVNLDPVTKISKIEITKDEYNRMALVVDWLFQLTDDTLPKFDIQIRNIHKFVKAHFKGKRRAIPGIAELEVIEAKSTTVPPGIP
jgi:hypothetical protein